MRPGFRLALQEQKVEHIQTAIRGRTPDPKKLYLADFVIKFNSDNQPIKVTCPHGQTEPAIQQPEEKLRRPLQRRSVSHLPLVDKCPAQPGKRDPRHQMRFPRHKRRPLNEDGAARNSRKKAATYEQPSKPHPQYQASLPGWQVTGAGKFGWPVW